jgi:hypothetical protein
MLPMAFQDAGEIRADGARERRADHEHIRKLAPETALADVSALKTRQECFLMIHKGHRIRQGCTEVNLWERTAENTFRRPNGSRVRNETLLFLFRGES